MILSAGLAGFIVVLAALAVIAGLIFTGIRLTRKADPRGDRFVKLIVVFSFSIGILGGLKIWNSYTSQIVEISATSNTEKVAIGNCSYTASDGQLIEINCDHDDCYIINVSGDELVEDYVAYGLMLDFGYVTPIPPHTYDNTSSPPDYYPWQTPPNEVESTINMDSKLWIRRPEFDDQYTHE